MQSKSTPLNLGDHGTGSIIIDTDGDSSSDWEEEQNNTDPNNTDIDGAGFSDTDERQQGTDPRTPAANPQPFITLQVRKKSITAGGTSPNLVNGDPFHPESVVSGNADIYWSSTPQGGLVGWSLHLQLSKSGPDLRAIMNDPTYEHLWLSGAQRA